ncbi:MAG TPA: 50S ribosomal protein L10 [Candidatus Paceibacterota bacterium]|nr:50S ribosomal protein L10 [Candidatus Paceibacterota bacterium]
MPRVKKTDHKREPSKAKIELVKKIADAIDKNQTIMFASIKGLPARQFQRIKKDLSKNTQVFILKKNMLIKSIDLSKKNNKSLKEYIKEDIAVLISNIDAFELATYLAESKVPVKAKIGQISDKEINVEPGPTELVAGPVVSELGSLGIKIEIKGGKIEIKEAKTIVKVGQAISEGACGIMSKLNIMPFSVGFIPLVAYDSKSNNIYTSLVIDKKGTLKELKEIYSKALGLAVSREYICKESLKYILLKAISHEKALENKVGINSKINEQDNALNTEKN